jgi:hypothetical protein
VKTIILTLVAMITVTGRTEAQFVLIDNFQKQSVGELSGQNGWTAIGDNAALVKVVADPTSAANRVLQYSAKAEGVAAYKSISIPNANTVSTLFFRMRRTPGEVNMNWGATDVAGPKEFADYEAQVNMQVVDTLNLRVRDRNAFVEVTPFAADTWYKTWVVINNSADTYEVFVQGGALGTATQMAAGGKTVFTFRNGQAANDLVNVFFRTNPPHTADFLIDDIYVDTAARNLGDPTAGSTR